MNLDLVPAETFSPGEHLRDELLERGWTVSHLAGLMGRPTNVVSSILEAKIAVTPDLAHALSAALGTSSELWLNLERSYGSTASAQGSQQS